ncbi:3-hydroxyacyl-ACP dehydratase FabZ [Peptoniphilus stercorisuis]|uniref:3-hydroxyacyl-[acyl-carrier-protein] dehydratase FabZ n=1 Tax=Peptoniphilus stercorisuis TaxID=1436965 RepID=A0ABS4KA89_9FIRM|nr:3-hydroxyacyl-ACP dehydratase FabZ [Peptoniphilus stercorisuis]MBP2024682.1 3-hydroxyacyl-[acyl-carrier-protein] dehydratase [Peptoniphilus stercorisuis]
MEYNSDEIKKILPHRYPFLLVDRIIDGKEKEFIVGIKNISISDAVFQGHFPNHHVYPGVLIIESMAQVGAILLLSEEENKGKIALFTGIKNAKFKGEVFPGDRLIIKCEFIEKRLNIGFASAKAYVENKLVAFCEMSFAISLP